MKKPGIEEIDYLKRLYETSFPVEERRDWNDVVCPRSANGPCLELIEHEGKTAGMLTWWSLGDVVYIEHFAIDPAVRNCGVGGRALDDFIRKMVPRKVVLEVEPTDNGGIADRRIDFYRRHGFEVLVRDYIQPPYQSGLPSVPLYIMSTGVIPDTGRLIKTLHAIVYGKR